MLFSSGLLEPTLIAKIDGFLSTHDMVSLYKSYSWQRDTYNAGFPDIFSLEMRLKESDQTQGITLEDIRAVASWGALRHQARITGPKICLPPHTLQGIHGAPLPSSKVNPEGAIGQLQKAVKGIGPTYQSKVLRFGNPQQFGAIDTRCVRVFGQGDSDAQGHYWLKLRIRNDGYGWHIPSYQAPWPSDYVLWNEILSYIASALPENCPHPASFYQAKLRELEKWEVADVEMALFAYVSSYLAKILSSTKKSVVKGIQTAADTAADVDADTDGDVDAHAVDDVDGALFISDKRTSVQALRNLVASFVEERRWQQFHTPKNLSMSIAIEAAELMELFQWSDERALDAEHLARVKEELADVVIYCLAMANNLDIDLSLAVQQKVDANGRKYPIEKYKGRYK